LPGDLPRGSYLLTLAILDPAGMTSACRFACKNYFTGGHHPIGRVSIGTTSNTGELDERIFDDLASDTTIGYRA